VDEDEALRILVATLRADHAALDRRVAGVEGGMLGIRRDLNAKHRENRRSIHDIRSSQQDIVDALHMLDLKFAKFTGYAVGAGAVVGLILKLLDHIWK
jgi:hypothetical protein